MGNTTLYQICIEVESTGRYEGGTAVPDVGPMAAEALGPDSAQLSMSIGGAGDESGPRAGYHWQTVEFPAASSIPATTTDVYACRLAHQRSGFYAAGRFWLFYNDGDEFSYKSSLDNITWTAATVIKDFGVSGFAAMYSIFFDGTYVHYACNDHYVVATGYFGIMYRRGVPNSDGTITWSSVEQEALDPDTLLAADISLAIDSNGCAWIGYCADADLDATITSSTATDGTWVTRAGHPYEFATADDWFVAVVPMTSGQVAAIVSRQAHTEETVRCYIWSGAAWGVEEVATTSKLRNSSGSGFYGQLCVLNIGADVHIVWHTDNDDIRYVRRTGGAWQAEVVVVDKLPTIVKACTPVIAADGSDMYCFWMRGSTVHYKKWTSAAGWDYWPSGLLQDTWQAECYSLEAYAVRVSGYLCLSYLAKTGSPYDITHVVFLGPWSSWEAALRTPPLAPNADHVLEDLTPGTTYYVRGWGQNSLAMFYTAQVSFETEHLSLVRSHAYMIG